MLFGGGADAGKPKEGGGGGPMGGMGNMMEQFKKVGRVCVCVGG